MRKMEIGGRAGYCMAMRCRCISGGKPKTRLGHYDEMAVWGVHGGLYPRHGGGRGVGGQGSAGRGGEGVAMEKR